MRNVPIALAFAAALTLGACGQSETTVAETTAAEPTVTVLEALPPPDQWAPQPADPAQANYGPDLADCGGAVAALANIDIATHPVRDGRWEDLLGTVLALSDKEPPYPNGLTARQAFEERKQVWLTRPREATEARAEACEARFHPQAGAQ